jgi:hypothetical protein
MNPSGANVATSKVDVVMKYVRANFPDKEVDHLPRSDGYADLFRVIDNRASVSSSRHAEVVRCLGRC